jgi:cytidylate kinase
MAVVTIRGPMGSGAEEVGRQVADRLHADYVDRQVIAEVAVRLQRQEQDVILKESPPATLLGRIAEALSRSYGFNEGVDGAFLPIWQMPLDDTRYLQALESVVRELARGPLLVIRGRGSQFILKDHPQALHVMLTAPLDVRVKRVMEELKLDADSAKREIARFDGSNRQFIKKYFQAELEDPACYDLVVNTGRFDLTSAASMILHVLSTKGQIGREQGKPA